MQFTARVATASGEILERPYVATHVAANSFEAVLTRQQPGAERDDEQKGAVDVGTEERERVRMPLFQQLLAAVEGCFAANQFHSRRSPPRSGII